MLHLPLAATRFYTEAGCHVIPHNDLRKASLVSEGLLEVQGASDHAVVVQLTGCPMSRVFCSRLVHSHWSPLQGVFGTRTFFLYHDERANDPAHLGRSQVRPLCWLAASASSCLVGTAI